MGFGSPINGPSFIPDGVPSLNPLDPDNSSSSRRSWKKERTYTAEEKRGRIEKPKGYDYKGDKKNNNNSSGSSFSIQSFIMAIIVLGVTLIIGIYIMGEISTTMTDSAAVNASTEVSNILSNNPLINWFPVIIVIAVATMVLGLLTKALTSSGIDGSSDNDNNDNDDSDDKPLVPPHKQTYLEYVKERLAVERLMHLR